MKTTTQSGNQAISIGIDASNIRMGGGVTHLLELLSAIDPKQMQVSHVYIWASEKTLSALPQASWIKKINPALLNRGLLYRIWWQARCLSSAVRAAQCDILFVPGGSYVGSFHPVVTMSQNLLPFEWEMIRKTGFSIRALKFIVLRKIHAFSFQRSDGVIFLTQYAKDAVLKVTGPLLGKTTVIAHGLNARFAYQPKTQLSITQYSFEQPYHLLYVSTIDVYKNQLELIDAVDYLRTKGYPLTLTLIGPGEARPLKKLEYRLHQLDPKGHWARYLGSIPYQNLHSEYQHADLGVFPSRCETFGMTVLEKMAIGLPIACSQESSMSDVLGEAGVYFDPQSPLSIAAAIEQLLLDPALRAEQQTLGFQIAQQYTWTQCAKQTVAFFHELVKSQSK